MYLMKCNMVLIRWCCYNCVSEAHTTLMKLNKRFDDQKFVSIFHIQGFEYVVGLINLNLILFSLFFVMIVIVKIHVSRGRTCISGNAKNWTHPIIYDQHFWPDLNVTTNTMAMRIYKMMSKYKNSNKKDSLFVSDLNFKMLNDGRLNYNGSKSIFFTLDLTIPTSWQD